MIWSLPSLDTSLPCSLGIKHMPTSGTLHLPGLKCSPSRSCHGWLTHPLGLSSYFSSTRGPSLTALTKGVPVSCGVTFDSIRLYKFLLGVYRICDYLAHGFDCAVPLEGQLHEGRNHGE